MKSRSKSNSEPLISRSRLTFYNHPNNFEQVEDDAHVEYRLEKLSDDLGKYSKECDFIIFNKDPSLDAKLLECREKRKEVFYSKGRDLYGYTVFEDGEVPTGCGMHSNDYLSSFDQNNIDEMDDIEYQEYDDCYLYLSKLSKLYYIKDRRVENVKLNSVFEFTSQLSEFMEDVDDVFTLKRMTYEDIFRIVTRMSGHMPTHMATAIPCSPYEKYETYKGLYEFYLIQKAAEPVSPATPPPYRHSHIVDHGSWHDVLITAECDEIPCDKPKYGHRM